MEPLSRRLSVLQWWLPGLLGFGLLAVYLSTMAPGFTWANGAADGGDLIGAAATGGVAHPTGYPVYLLLAGLFQHLRIGTLAYRTNLLSGLSMAGAALLVYLTVRAALPARAPLPRELAGAVSAVAFGLSPLAWSQAVITEVHALHVLFLAALMYLVVRWRPPSPAQAVTLGLVQGLALGNHVLSVLMLPAVLVAASWRRGGDANPASETGRTRAWDWRTFGLVVAGVAVGLLSYLILPARAALHPAVNWGDPATPERFLWLISGQLYRGYLVLLDGSVIFQHAAAWASQALMQFGLAGLALAVLGATVFFSPSPVFFLTI